MLEGTDAVEPQQALHDLEQQQDTFAREAVWTEGSTARYTAASNTIRTNEEVAERRERQGSEL